MAQEDVLELDRLIRISNSDTNIKTKAKEEIEEIEDNNPGYWIATDDRDPHPGSVLCDSCGVDCGLDSNDIDWATDWGFRPVTNKELEYGYAETVWSDCDGHVHKYNVELMCHGVPCADFAKLKNDERNELNVYQILREYIILEENVSAIIHQMNYDKSKAGRYYLEKILKEKKDRLEEIKDDATKLRIDYSKECVKEELKDKTRDELIEIIINEGK